MGVNGESDDVSLGPKTHCEIMTNNMSLPDRKSSITASLFVCFLTVQQRDSSCTTLSQLQKTE